jgi:hypothetical protein
VNVLLVLLGAGTVNYHLLAQMARSPVARLVRHIIICDQATIRAENSITCPLYFGHEHEPKCNRLAALAMERFAEARPRISAIHRRVEELPWDQMLARPGTCCERVVLVLTGLDDWQSRLAAMEDLRHDAMAHADSHDSFVFIQVGLDQHQASIAVLGVSYGDPCPACGKQVLPGPQPCVARLQNHRLLRGNLRCEARAAGRCVRRIVDDLVLSRQWAAWLNTKTNLVADPGGRTFRQFTRPCQHQAECFGPHSAAGPLRWEQILSRETER